MHVGAALVRLAKFAQQRRSGRIERELRPGSTWPDEKGKTKGPTHAVESFVSQKAPFLRGTKVPHTSESANARSIVRSHADESAREAQDVAAS
jgi:hypothetical protein